MDYSKILSIEDLKGEVWLPIQGFDGRYWVSNFGRLKIPSYFRSNGSFIKSKIMKQSITVEGYYKVVLFKNEKINLYIHRLVAIQFLSNPDNKKEVNHKDADKSNNSLYNLEWTTTKENSHHAWGLGLIKKRVGKENNFYGKKGDNSARATKIKQIKADGSVVEWGSLTTASEAVGVKVSSLNGCLKGRQKTSAGCKWEYA